jgi:hypothetical protein
MGRQIWFERFQVDQAKGDDMSEGGMQGTKAPLQAALACCNMTAKSSKRVSELDGSSESAIFREQ